MSVAKSNLNSLIFIFAVVGLLLFVGCGGSAEKEHMSTFLQEYQSNLEDYAEAINKADSAKKSEIEGKLEASEAQWLVLMDEAVENLTPQAMEKFDKEFKAVKMKYQSLSNKS
jgi:outer membrane murein-binding lipoprotein Lpp